MKIVGHRGAKGLAGENTLSSLVKALTYKVDELEFDVRVTKDNIPVLHHDSSMLSLQGQKYFISRHSLKELRKHKPELTTLKEVFERIDKKVPLYIEIKSGSSVKPIIKVLKEQLKKGRPANNMHVASFSQRILLEVHTALPDLPKIVNESWSGIRARRRAKALNAKRLGMSQRWMRTRLLKSLNKRGFELYLYTINQPKKVKKWQKHGLAGVITDFPDRFRSKR